MSAITALPDTSQLRAHPPVPLLEAADLVRVDDGDAYVKTGSATWTRLPVSPTNGLPAPTPGAVLDARSRAAVAPWFRRG